MIRLTASPARPRRLLLGVLAPLGLALGLGTGTARPAGAQWVTTPDQFYLPASHNWVFRKYYPFADRLFNAFDYGHSILYETLWTKPKAPASDLEVKEYEFLTRKVLPNPPRVPLEEVAIEIQYARLAPEARQMFDWAHVLHRQAYDVLADERLTQAQKDAEIARLLAYYKSRPDLAFSSKPKSMKLMQEQPYSLAFRKHYPKFNGLIWGYHWLQVGLYEPLMVGKTFDERQALTTATVARFRQMLERPTETMPYQMPMTAAIAPTFAARYPEVAIIFDNLHSMHDVVSDILANDSVPRKRKRVEIVRAARLFRDDTSYLIASTEAWRTMAREMGVENMGGPAVGFTTALPTPTVTYGAVMTHDDSTGRMVGVKYGAMTGAHGDMPGMQHGATADSASGAQQMDHAAMGHGTSASASEQRDSSSAAMMEMQMRMMGDPVIRDRVMADTAMRRMMTETTAAMPAEHRQHMEAMMREAARPATNTTPRASARAGGARSAAPRRTAPAKPAPKKPAAKKPPMDSMPGMDHGNHPMGKP